MEFRLKAELHALITSSCKLSTSACDDFEKGILLAVNHTADGDSTGSITGNILGLKLGIQAD
jgi:ADP-ribosylglycohydrolase